jgi:hypothetical protein
MAAIANWTAAADFPAQGSPRDKLGFAVKLASLRSAGTRWQPWRFQISDHFAELAAHDPLAQPWSDADEREALIQGGTALQHLKLVLKRYRCFGRVELFPDLDQPTLAARVHLGCGGARDAQEQVVSDVMTMEETDFPKPQPLGASAPLELLCQAPPGERGWLEFARSDSSRQRLLELLHPSSRVQLKEIRLQNQTLVRSPDGDWESTRFSGPPPQERFSRWRRPALAVKVQPNVPTRATTPAVRDSALTTGTFAVLKTKTDDKHGWLAAGQMLARLLLHARALGVACTPFLDPLRHPELRSELRTAIGHKGFTQVILHFSGLQLEAPIPSPARYATTATGSST